MLALLVAGLSPSAQEALAAENDLGKVDRMLVLKGRRELQLLRAGAVLKSYPIALGPRPRGPKQRLDDDKTPEGVYTIDGRNMRTAYHLALHVSYPSEADRARAQAAHVAPGGGIWIHGMPARFGRTDLVRLFKDRTNGCISVGKIAIEEIRQAVDDGTPIEIRP